MESSEQGFSLRELIKVATRRRALLLAVTGSILLLALLFALLLPSSYRSNAVVLIEKQEIPADLVRSTVTSYADQRIQVISQRVMTSENLTNIIQKYNLYEKKRRKEPLEVVLEDMRGDIVRQMISADVLDPVLGRAVSATIAFRLSFVNQSPSVAQKVVNEVVSLYLNENLKSRTGLANWKISSPYLRNKISISYPKIQSFNATCLSAYALISRKRIAKETKLFSASCYSRRS